ncbi:unnamed protein product, partial [Sphenostylis stenocarpa]
AHNTNIKRLFLNLLMVGLGPFQGTFCWLPCFNDDEMPLSFSKRFLPRVGLTRVSWNTNYPLPKRSCLVGPRLRQDVEYNTLYSRCIWRERVRVIPIGSKMRYSKGARIVSSDG